MRTRQNTWGNLLRDAYGLMVSPLYILLEEAGLSTSFLDRWMQVIGLASRPVDYDESIAASLEQDLPSMLPDPRLLARWAIMAEMTPREREHFIADESRGDDNTGEESGENTLSP